MPVLIGTPSLVIASRVQVYQTCSVDLTWQRSIHSCQRCPRAVLVANAVSVPPITQSNVERAHSRFCPAGVHMSNCVPASDILTPCKQSAPKSLQPGAKQTHGNTPVIGSGGLELVPALWGPPNLPVPTASPHHPVHAATLARSSHSSAVSIGDSTTPVDPNATMNDRFPLQKTKLLIVGTSDMGIDGQSDSSLSLPTSLPLTLTKAETTQFDRVPTSSIALVHESQKPETIPVTTNSVPVTSKNNTSLIAIENSDIQITDLDISVNEDVTVQESDKSAIQEPSEALTSDNVVTPKVRKESSPSSAAKPKGSLPASGGSQPQEEHPIPTHAVTIKGPPAQDDVKDMALSDRTYSRFPDRAGFKQDAPAVSVQSSELKKEDSVQSPNRIQPSTSPRDVSRSSTYATQSSASSGGGGVGDVGPVLAKSNGVRFDQTRITPTDTRGLPSKQIASVPLPSTRKTTIPSFHFPIGTTRMTGEEISFELDRCKRELTRLVDQLGPEGKKSDPSIPYAQFGQVAKALNCPFYWKHLIYSASGGTTEHLPIPLSAVRKLWSQVLVGCPDEASRFVHLLTKGRATSLVQADFNPLIQDILESHPGLAFLQAARDFHSRYVATVVARIFFNVNGSWSGRISLGELRKSNFLSVLASLESEEDINLVTQYFSYEHFYVIYCKFWELDEDHDLIISRADLARHNNYAISERMIERIFSGTVTRGTAFKESVMTYPDFVWFLLAEEDKRHPRSIEYWFRCMDLDGDGLLSMYELEYFYSEQVARMEEMGIEPISFEDCLCQCLDMVKPVLVDKIRLSDLKHCRLSHVFFDTFFNLPKYLQHEQRDPFTNLRDIEEGLNELSDWDRYAAEAYEMLVSVESGNQEDGMDEDGDEDEVDDVVQLASSTPLLTSKTENNMNRDNGTTNTKSDAKQGEHASLVGAGE